MKKIALLQSAASLRKKGYSYREISETLNISKGTCYLWLKDIKLSKTGLERLEGIKERARKKARESVRQRINKRDDEIKSKVQKELLEVKLDKKLDKLLCSLLYWSEGEKTTGRVAFINSDPALVNLFLELFKSSFDIDNSKFSAVLHLHHYHNRSKQIIFWSKLTGIPSNRITIYDKINTGQNQKENYPGCISVRYHDIVIFKELEYYFKLFAEHRGGVVQW